MINLIGELLIVRPEVPSGPIRLPDWKRSLKGEVVSVSPNVKSVKSGDVVSFGAAVGMDAIYAGEEIRILKEKDLDFVYEDICERCDTPDEDHTDWCDYMNANVNIDE